MNRKFEYLLFDLDNTLLDFDASSHKAFKHIIPHVDAEELGEMYAKYRIINKKVWEELESGLITFEELSSKRWALLFEALGLSDLDPLQINKNYFDYIKSDLVYIKGADQVIKELSSLDYPMGIITNGLSEVQWPRLNLSGFDKIFDPIIISNEIGVAKPEKGFFEHAYSKMDGQVKSEVLVIGDTYNSDIVGGSNFGFKTCWFTQDQSGTSKNKEKADFIIGDIKELLSFVI